MHLNNAAGADVGGFFGDPDPELLTRWYQAAALQPFFRGHAHIGTSRVVEFGSRFADTKRREPWLFGEPHTSRIRAAIRERYALLPYLYTLFWEASLTGTPVMRLVAKTTLIGSSLILRPLWSEDPDDTATYDLDDQFMLGSALLVKPITSAGTTSTSVYLPAGVMTLLHCVLFAHLSIRLGTTSGREERFRVGHIMWLLLWTRFRCFSVVVRPPAHYPTLFEPS